MITQFTGFFPSIFADSERLPGATGRLPRQAERAANFCPLE